MAKIIFAILTCLVGFCFPGKTIHHIEIHIYTPYMTTEFLSLLGQDTDTPGSLPGDGRSPGVMGVPRQFMLHNPRAIRVYNPAWSEILQYFKFSKLINKKMLK